MKMARIVLDQEEEIEVVEHLEKAGFHALTRFEALKESFNPASRKGEQTYKKRQTVILLALREEEVEKACDAIQEYLKKTGSATLTVLITPLDRMLSLRAFQS